MFSLGKVFGEPLTFSDIVFFFSGSVQCPQYNRIFRIEFPSANLHSILVCPQNLFELNSVSILILLGFLEINLRGAYNIDSQFNILLQILVT